jgi:hypothetical protein
MDGDLFFRSEVMVDGSDGEVGIESFSQQENGIMKRILKS